MQKLKHYNLQQKLKIQSDKPKRDRKFKPRVDYSKSEG